MSLKQLFFFIIIVVEAVTATRAVAQAPGGGKGDGLGQDVLWEWGLHGGNLLPNQIPGLTEITGLGGLRVGYRISPMGFIESGVASGSANGATWTNSHLAMRMEIPVETIVGHVFAGIDGTYYQGVGRDKKLFGGGHVGGGVQAQLGGSVWFRSNMKFTINPGTSMYIDFGFMFRIPGS